MMLNGNSDTINIIHYTSPCGELLLGAYGGRLCLCDWLASKHRESTDRRIRKYFQAEYEICQPDGESSSIWCERSPAKAVLCEAVHQLDEYFSKGRTQFELPIFAVGTTFQNRVWSALRQIPYGSTISYAALAEKIGHPKAVRAVANANGANPLSIIVPCHRVIGSKQTLTGYAGGLDAKQFLLELEGGIRSEELS